MVNNKADSYTIVVHICNGGIDARMCTSADDIQWRASRQTTRGSGPSPSTSAENNTGENNNSNCTAALETHII